MLATANAGKNREGFWKNAGEWTVRVEINEEEQLKITRINKKTKKYEHAGEKKKTILAYAAVCCCNNANNDSKNHVRSRKSFDQYVTTVWYTYQTTRKQRWEDLIRTDIWTESVIVV